MDLPSLLSQSRIFRAYGLTPDLNMRYGADIHITPNKFTALQISSLDTKPLVLGKRQFISLADTLTIKLPRSLWDSQYFARLTGN
jgi:hypothetical protein